MQSQFIKHARDVKQEFAEARRLTERIGRWVNTVESGRFTRLGGCYALVGNGECYYVGQSRCIADRIESHHWVQTATGVRTQKWGFLPGVVIKTRASERGSYGHLTLEAKLIERIRPKFNRGRFIKTKRSATDREPPAETPVYSPKTGERLVPIADVAAHCQLSVNAMRHLISQNVVEAVPEGIIDWLMEQERT